VIQKNLTNSQKLIDSNTVSLLIIYASFYYPIGAFIILQLGIPSTPVNIFFRSIVAITSLFLITIMLIKKSHIVLNKIIWLLIMWWIFYSLRIIIDLSRGVKFADYGNEFVYGITFGNILLPIIAVILNKETFNYNFFYKWSFNFILIGSTLILISLLILSKGDFTQLVNSRLELVNEAGNSNDNIVLNAILIGFYGEILFILSFNNLLSPTGRFSKILNYISLSIGLILLFFGSSRGPFISTVLISFLLYLSNFYYKKYKIIYLLKNILYLLILIFTLKLTFLKNVSTEDFAMLRRITQFIEDRKSNENDDRLNSINSAWQDFKDSPVFGKQFVGTLDGYYPHNVFVEIFMATGLIGACLFFPILFYSIFKAFKFLFSRNKFKIQIAILFFPCLFSLLTSGSLFQGVEFWLMTTLVIITNNKNLKLHE
jgi:hypothetical protein